MPSITTQNADDPVSRLIDRSTRRSGHFPIPLIATSYDIKIAGGLASVTARRTFRNQEAQTIEATLTFPVSVHAVLYSLEARIGGRTVKAVAKDRSAAREDYEDAVDRGKSAVLHEELLRGIHMLSVAHVAPGTDIEVTARFAQPLSWIGGRAMLRIPTTVGDVYGDSGLADCDELVHGGPVAAADLNVTCDAGCSALIARAPVAAGTRVWLDRPISIEIQGWAARDIRGCTAAGEAFRLKIGPVPEGDAALDVAFLIDRSGSMDTKCADDAHVSKHTAVLIGLSDAARSLGDADRINIWQFDDRAEDLGTAHGRHVKSLIRMLAAPRGGTEIGRSIETLLAQRPVRDVVLVTDGQSHALDVQKLAAGGVRYSVVLIGEDSLEANVGHLAALTGGDIFVAEGADISDALKDVLASLRATPHETGTAGDAHLVRGRRGGMDIVATREPAETAAGADDPETARAAGAYAAGLSLATLPAADAARLAVAEGLVSHLTSLILVDEEGEAQAGLPAMRKVALPSPATVAPARMGFGGAVFSPQARTPALQLSRSAAFGPARQNFLHGRSKSVVVQRSAAPPVDYFAQEEPPRSPPVSRSDLPCRSYRDADDDVDATSAAPVQIADPSRAPSLAELPRRIDWRDEGQRLVEGNLIGLPHDIADAIDSAALIGVVKRAAKRLGVSARVLVIGLLARVVSGSDRHAERVYRAILAKAKTRDIAHAAERLGLSAA